MTPFDNTQAETEGWSIFEASGSTDGDWQIQRCDEMALFEDDQSAWTFVHDFASAGSSYHQSALDWLKANCLEEYEAIMKHVKP